VQEDARAVAAGVRARGHVDPAPHRDAQAPFDGRRAVGDGGARPAGEDRGREPTVARQQRVSDRVHAAMDAVQPTHGDPIAHGAGAETELDELPERDDPVLAGSELRDRPIQRGGLRRYVRQEDG